jgi:hypothetical protein
MRNSLSGMKSHETSVSRESQRIECSASNFQLLFDHPQLEKRDHAMTRDGVPAAPQPEHGSGPHLRLFPFRGKSSQTMVCEIPET